MQLDADDESEPFFRPPPVPTAPIPKSGEPSQTQAKARDGGEEEEGGQQAQVGMGTEGGVVGEGGAEGETAQAKAAAATVEQEE